jgi:hypothetical protein
VRNIVVTMSQPQLKTTIKALMFNEPIPRKCKRGVPIPARNVPRDKLTGLPKGRGRDRRPTNTVLREELIATVVKEMSEDSLRMPDGFTMCGLGAAIKHLALMCKGADCKVCVDCSHEYDCRCKLGVLNINVLFKDSVEATPEHAKYVKAGRYKAFRVRLDRTTLWMASGDDEENAGFLGIQEDEAHIRCHIDDKIAQHVLECLSPDIYGADMGLVRRYMGLCDLW